jgi:hypothetical protein
MNFATVVRQETIRTLVEQWAIAKINHLRSTNVKMHQLQGSKRSRKSVPGSNKAA